MTTTGRKIRFKKKICCTICVAKIKMLISCAVTDLCLCFRLCMLLVFLCDSYFLLQKAAVSRTKSMPPTIEQSNESDGNFLIFLVLTLYGKMINEPEHEKTNNLGFRPVPTQTGLYSHRRWLEAGNFGFRK